MDGKIVFVHNTTSKQLWEKVVFIHDDANKELWERLFYIRLLIAIIESSVLFQMAI